MWRLVNSTTTGILFRFVAFPSDWTKSVVPMSLDAFE